MTLSVQDVAIQLVFKKGMTDKDAIVEIEKTRQLSPLTITSIRDALDRWRYFHPTKTRDGSERCYFCETKVGEAQYCYGCGWWICSSCDFRKPVGKHQPSDHLINEEGYTYNEVVKHLVESKGRQSGNRNQA